MSVAPSSSRAFSGSARETETSLSKLETGELGESIVVAYLQSKGLKDARSLNVGLNNFPVDLVQNGAVYEVKAGLVSNSQSAQQWRATIGQPGPKERDWLKEASPDEKRAWNERKARAVLNRKERAVKQVSERLGRRVKSHTVGVIIDPDRGIADLHIMDGFHRRVGWTSELAKRTYVGSFRYTRKKSALVTVLREAHAA